MGSPAHSVLHFYSVLRRHDPDAPEVQRALVFTRVAQDLLLRVAAAWAVQRGLESVPADAVPPREALFSGMLENRPLTSTEPESGLGSLLASIADWLAAGFSTDPFASSYQVWVGDAGSRQIQLSGPVRDDKLPDALQLETAKGLAYAATLTHSAVTAIGHYDVHGLAMLALGLASLREAGVSESSGILSFEATGDIGKLWKRTVPQALKRGGEGSTVVLIDCPVHSRTPEHTLRALRTVESVSGSKVVLIDHHPDTIELAPLIARDGLQLVLTDVLSCSLLGTDNSTSRALRILGALGDKVPEVATAYPHSTHADLWAANTAYQDALLYFSPTPKELKQNSQQPVEPLWESLAKGAAAQPELAGQTIVLPLPPVASPALPAWTPCGAVLFVTERLVVLGRSWYGILESLMQAAGLSYAVAVRVLDGQRANMLLLTHWQHSYVPPIRSFIPEHYLSRCLGHPAAVWVDLPVRDALEFLEELTANLNSFFGQPADFSPVATVLRQNILEQAPSVYGGPLTAGPIETD